MTVLLTIVGRPHNPRPHQYHAVTEKDTYFLNLLLRTRVGQVLGSFGAGAVQVQSRHQTSQDGETEELWPLPNPKGRPTRPPSLLATG